MTWTDFPYVCRITTNGTYPCDIPQVPLLLSYNGSKPFKTSGLVDSGCTLTHIREDIAVPLGIDLAACQKVPTTGICGETEGSLAEIDMEVPGLGGPFRSRVLFVKDLPVSVLLGQERFFDIFSVKFEKPKGTFALERVA